MPELHKTAAAGGILLTEGWDTNTVTHILGVRAFGTQLLYAGGRNTRPRPMPLPLGMGARTAPRTFDRRSCNVVCGATDSVATLLQRKKAEN